MTKLKFCIKDCFSESDPVFEEITKAVLQHAGTKTRYDLVIRVSYNHGGEIVVMRNLVQLIETTVNTYQNIYFDLRFGGFAVSAAAFFFLYFGYYTLLPRVRVSSTVRLCLVYHKPRSVLKRVSGDVLIFANNAQGVRSLSANEREELLQFTGWFDNILNSFVQILKDQTGAVVEQHLMDSYNTNGDLSFTLSPRTFKTF
ncbi:hypothetical protein C7431_11115 [Pantoea allii]|uniref:Uncharacterized protein n=1 Tax=Pantoea allii TaxID=574096 RepID=A0A2V2BCZ3_9GAMM|nr:hypothetical protein [Pantoea allii]PWK94280.1 hypothetical protein C7431_11115 [Pantoea allii]